MLLSRSVYIYIADIDYDIIFLREMFMYTDTISIKKSYHNCFQGRFICPEKLKNKQAQFLNKVLATELDGVSANNLIKTMPFDVDVVCLNPTKRAINPRFNFWIKHTKKQATVQGCINLTSKDSLESNICKLNNFIKNFKNRTDKLTGDEKLTPQEELCRQVDFLLFGKYKSYFE